MILPRCQDMALIGTFKLASIFVGQVESTCGIGGVKGSAKRAYSATVFVPSPRTGSRISRPVSFHSNPPAVEPLLWEKLSCSAGRDQKCKQNKGHAFHSLVGLCLPPKRALRQIPNGRSIMAAGRQSKRTRIRGSPSRISKLRTLAAPAAFRPLFASGYNATPCPRLPPPNPDGMSLANKLSDCVQCS